MNDALVSVVIPVFDRAVPVVEAVDSVLAQDDVDLEIVIVDDGSTDGSAVVIDRLAATDPRVRALHQPNQGPSAARNLGVAHSHGHWLTFLDSDDLMPPGRLRDQIEVLLTIDGPALVMGVEDIEIAPGCETPENVRAVLERDEPQWYAMSFMTTRAVFDSVGGFDESMRLGEDTELMFRMHRAGVYQARIERVWTHRRILGDNLVYDHAAVRRAGLVALHKNARTRTDGATSDGGNE